MGDDPIVFDDWEHVLTAEIPAERRSQYREAIVKFRYWLRQTGKSPVQDSFKAHLEWKKSYLPPDRFEIRREALRWYYRTGLMRQKTVSGNQAAIATDREQACGTRAPAPQPSGGSQGLHGRRPRGFRRLTDTACTP